MKYVNQELKPLDKFLHIVRTYHMSGQAMADQTSDEGGEERSCS